MDYEDEYCALLENTADMDSEFSNVKNSFGGSAYTMEQEAINSKYRKKKFPGLKTHGAKSESLSFRKLFQFARWRERILTALGLLAALVGSAAQPVALVFIGELLDRFVSYGMLLFQPGECHETEDYGPQLNITLDYNNHSLYTPVVPPGMILKKLQDSFLHDCTQISLKVCGTAALQAVAHYAMVVYMFLAAEAQSLAIRKAFVKSVLRQECAWFDQQKMGDFASKATSELELIKEGLGEKLALAVYYIFSSLFSLVVAFSYSWKLSLLVLSFLPIYIAISFLLDKIQSRHTMSEILSSGRAGAVAEEVVAGIRTVSAFGGEQHEIGRYNKALEEAQKSALSRALLTAIGSGLLWLFLYSSYAVAFWYGAKTVISERCDAHGFGPSSLLTVFLCMMTAALNIGNLPPYFEVFSLARGAAQNLFPIIHKVPVIDSQGRAGDRPLSFEGRIRLKDVVFRYPSRPEVPVLQGLSLEVYPGETVALVGASGCGKSTVIQLLQRYYDPLEGKVEVDNRELRHIHLPWWRCKLGVVEQEPVLFAGTIAYNIGLGHSGASQIDIENAAKKANAHDFIMLLPQSYESVIGERGTQLSGGQKQRIAIARALVRNPRILLLDEATSALDTESESIVQEALEKVTKCEGRSTILVAHRLSTVRSADRILVLNEGRVEEEGSHNQLMDLGGIYCQMVIAQLGPSEESSSASSVASLNVSTSEMCRKTIPKETKIAIVNEKSSLRGKSAKPTDKKESIPESGLQCRLFRMMAGDWHLLVVGAISSFFMGSSYPGSAVLFGLVLQALTMETNKAYSYEDFYSLLFLVLGAAAGLASFFQVLLFSVAGERLTLRLRKMAFSSLIRQEISWFERPENSTGAICSRLSSDAANIQGATGARVSMLCQATSTLSTSLFIGLYLCWRVGLVAMVFVPLLFILTVLKVRLLSGQLFKDKKVEEAAAQIAVEAIQNVRTVQALQQETGFYEKYMSSIESSVRRGTTTWLPHLQGLVFGLAESVPFFAYIAVMQYGSTLVANKELKFDDLYKISQSIVVGALMFSQSVAFAPDYHKSLAAAGRIFALLDFKPKIDIFSKQGLTPSASRKLSIKLSNLWFRYPSRPDWYVLRGLNISLCPGEKVAIVGASGCGKSTCLQLLQRFYDVQEGALLLDGLDIRDLNLRWMRSQLGVVPQEPMLFGCTVAENIAYGDHSRSVSLNEIVSAATKAGIHEFVSSLPQGYETHLGNRGTQLSGGQKQRIAIARALIRDPKILLLDEATSALDTESEKSVQEALETASEGRTSIWVAHRLTSLRRVDRILVLRDGCLAEEGTHKQLMALQGIYYRLYSLQTKCRL